MKKRSGKGTPAGKRRAKDLAPRKTRNVEAGALNASIVKKDSDTVNGIIQKIG
jgi:hypothetical protein